MSVKRSTAAGALSGFAALYSSSTRLRWYAGDGVYRIKNLKGRPDDAPGDATDGETVLDWTQAQREARKVAARKQREALGLDEATGPYIFHEFLPRR